MKSRALREPKKRLLNLLLRFVIKVITKKLKEKQYPGTIIRELNNKGKQFSEL
jgi:hypothetical protein